jgi:hypothetical protein
MGKVKFAVSVYSLFYYGGTAKCMLVHRVYFQCKRSYHSFINLNFILLAKHAITVEFVLEKAIAVRGDNVIFFKMSTKIRYLEFLIISRRKSLLKHRKLKTSDLTLCEGLTTQSEVTKRHQKT